jgi:hypothetical protein
MILGEILWQALGVVVTLGVLVALVVICERGRH